MPGDAHQLHETVQVVLRTQPHTSDAGQLSVARLDESRLTEHVHVPQSLGQLEHDSPEDEEQTLSPQTGAHAPQSLAQDEHDSLPLQVPSPQEGAQAPQSLAHDEHDSLPLQVPSPQEGAQAPQSLAQDEHDSVEAQLPSPQLAAGPQVQLP